MLWNTKILQFCTFLKPHFCMFFFYEAYRASTNIYVDTAIAIELLSMVFNLFSFYNLYTELTKLGT